MARTWRVAKALDQLLAELNSVAPRRSKASDGAIGDAAHATRDSDHNPWVKDGAMGVVTARDFTHDPANGADMHVIVAGLVSRRDSRIKYIIWDRKIWRSYARAKTAKEAAIPAWTAAAYTGANSHTHHAHVSVNEAKASYDATSPWGLVEAPAAPVAPTPKTSKRETTLPDFQGGSRPATVKAIQQECVRQGVTMPEQIAYVLATVQHETANTFQPVREAYYLKGKAEAYRKKNLRYYPYYGRGYVQLTWKDNYASYGKRLDLDLVNSPDLALRPDVALYILVHGMKTGSFTGKKLSNYITAKGVDFRKARAIINATDKADIIAGYAQKWLGSA